MSVLYKALQKAAQENQAQADEQAQQAAPEAPPVAPEPEPAPQPPAAEFEPEPTPEPPAPEPEPEPAPPPPPPEPEQQAVPHHDDEDDEDDSKFEAIMAAPAAAAAPKRGKFLSSGGDKMDVRVMIGGGVVVVLIVVLAFFFLQGGPAPPPQAPQIVQTPTPSDPPATAETVAPVVTADTAPITPAETSPPLVEPSADTSADPIVVADATVALEPAPIVDEAPAPIVEDAPVQTATAPATRPSIVPQRETGTTSRDVDPSQLTPEQMAAIPVDEPMPIVSEDDPARSLSPPISIRRSSLALAGVGDAVQVREVSAVARNNASAGYDALVRGDFDTALGFYELALQDEPGSILSQLGRASALHKLERYAEAGAAYQAVLQTDPKNREALTNLTAIIGQSSPAEAVRRLQDLEREHPNFSPIKAQIGLAQARLGNNTQAVRALSRAANMAPENVMYQYNLAVTLDRMGRGAQAMTAYERTIAALIQTGSTPQGLSRQAVEQRLNFLRSR